MRAHQGTHTCRFSQRHSLPCVQIPATRSTSSHAPRDIQYAGSSVCTSHLSSRLLTSSKRVKLFQGPGQSSFHWAQVCGIVRGRGHALHPARAAAGEGGVPGEPSPSGTPLPRLVPRGGEAGPGPGSVRDAVDAPGTGPGGPRRPPLGRRLARALLRPLATLAQAVAALFRRFIPNAKQRRRAIFGIMVVLLGASVGFGASLGATRRRVHVQQEVVYSQFLNLVKQGSVRSVRMEETGGKAYFDVKAPGLDAAADGNVGDGARSWENGRVRGGHEYVTKCIDDPNLIPVLIAAGVEFGAVKPSVTNAVTRVLLTAAMLWIPLIPLMIFMRQALNTRSGARSKKASGSGAAPSVVTFSDVAGVDSALAELREVVACLRDAGAYSRLGAKMPSGVLLTGPPGTGKTLLAKAVAGEAGVPFFASSASEFVELFVGRGAARVRDLFAEARKRAPSVVFIDELDAIGGRRGLGLNEERDQTLNQLLTELDGFEARTGVLLLAATNRPEVLDKALTRPGRLSRRVVVPLPDERGRAAILAVHLRPTPMLSAAAKAEACAAIARLTGGFSGAELANVANEAALLAVRKGAEVVGLAELVEAVQRTQYGVNGGAPVPWAGVQSRLTDALVSLLSGRREARLPAAGPS